LSQLAVRLGLSPAFKTTLQTIKEILEENSFEELGTPGSAHMLSYYDIHNSLQKPEYEHLKDQISDDL